MGKTLYGVFDTEREMIQAIQSLKEKGVHEGEITVMADKKEDLDFVNEKHDPDVDVVTNYNEESFIDKMKQFFLNEGSEDIRNRLGELGLADSEATAYINEVEAGKFLILLDESETVTARENTTSNRIEDTDEPLVNPLKTGVVNNPDPNLFPETTANAFQTREMEAQPGRSEELHGNSANIYKNEEMDAKRAQEREIWGNSTEKFKKQKSRNHEDPIYADTDENLDVQGSLDRTARPAGSGQQEIGLQDEYIKNRINTDNL
ncbi:MULTISPECIES: general stress protein [unclassified Bacillus (in: firmicutes)]|uniref:general stress protein n=1 Tax=unclassified Bacillus (in: firmicutes) TaxID=185979 RepID=UPI001BE89466|nr:MULTISPECIES: general stress protein [unclassified Bacillus (in: firmicutes)]MBT2616624.1 general stress protein [Bacillus sp. ISL-78]MBT2631029.1 general stress protein [Bacillus sp. ISL-101]MBT2716319.1 general stress protein [Bacillus sp. ISL-57]